MAAPVALAARIEAGLRAAADPERARAERAYLRSDREFLGAGVPRCRRLARAAAREARPDRHCLLAAVEHLWATGVHDCCTAAVELLADQADLLHAGDAGGVVERLLREARTWALVDPLAVRVAGPLAERDDLSKLLDRWAADPDFWLRRAALLALLPALRRGEGDFARFSRYADALLDEREFFVRKAIGWVLRETSKSRPDLVAAWLRPRVERASGVTFREAVKYLPGPERDELVAARRRDRSA